MDQISLKLRKKMDTLLDDRFIKDFFNGNLKMFFPEAIAVKIAKRIIHKDVRGKHDYTLIMEFILKLTLPKNKTITKSVFSKTHSDEGKNKSIYYMEILYKNGFNSGLYQVPRPLIYIPEMRTGFYEGVRGKSLFACIVEKNYKKAEIILKDSAHWIAKLHDLDLDRVYLSGLSLSRIKNNQPPINDVLSDMKRDYLKLYKQFLPVYRFIEKSETEVLKKIKKAGKVRLIYADYHAKNVIIPSHAKHGITAIDFTDLALGDPAKDIGTFLEQLFFMPKEFEIYLSKSIERRWQETFCQEYINGAETNTAIDWERINLYRAWTCLRNIIHFYYKEDPKHFIWGLLEEAKKYLA